LTDQEIEQRRQHAVLIDRVQARNKARYLEVTTPVLTDTERDRLDSVGSGLFLAVGAARFFVTAAHLANNTNPLIVNLNDQMVDLGGVQHIVAASVGAESGADRDEIDVAVYHLPKELTRGLSETRFVQMGEIGTMPAEIGTAGLVVAGYPRSRQKEGFKRNTVGSELVPVMAKEGQPNLYRWTRRDRETNIVLNYPVARIWSAKGPSRSLSLRGMSGSGVWLLSGPPSVPTGPPSLVGVFTEWHDKTHQYLLATRIEVVLDSIREMFPDVEV
jgi:hypothetical protein